VTADWKVPMRSLGVISWCLFIHRQQNFSAHQLLIYAFPVDEMSRVVHTTQRLLAQHKDLYSRTLLTSRTSSPPTPRLNLICYRCLHDTRSLNASRPPKSRDRGPPSKEDTQTDFAALNVLGSAPPPSTGIDACTDDGFALNSNIRVTGSGVLLVGGEAFRWSPWIRAGRGEGTITAGARGDDAMTGKLLNTRGQWEVGSDAWGVLELAWPKPGMLDAPLKASIRMLTQSPDLLIIGTGPSTIPIAPVTRKQINDLGIRIEVQDTRNAAAQYNLLATERGVEQVAAALVPIGWKEVC